MILKGLSQRELGYDRGKWRALVNTVMKHWVPQIVGNFLTSWTAIRFSRSTLLHAANWFVRYPIHAESVQFGFKLNAAKGWITDFETWLLFICHTKSHADTGLTAQRDEMCTNKRGIYDQGRCISVNVFFHFGLCQSYSVRLKPIDEHIFEIYNSRNKCQAGATTSWILTISNGTKTHN